MLDWALLLHYYHNLQVVYIGLLLFKALLCFFFFKCCFTSTQTIRLLGVGSPGRPSRLSHSSWWCRASCPRMSVDTLGTNCDQCLSMVQCCFTSTGTIRLVRTGSPGRPPRLSHSSRTLTAPELWAVFVTCCVLGSLPVVFPPCLCSHLSEQQRAYGRVTAQEDLTHKLPRDLKSDVGKMMRDADNKSNVFRSGDYDNIGERRRAWTSMHSKQLVLCCFFSRLRHSSIRHSLHMYLTNDRGVRLSVTFPTVTEVCGRVGRWCCNEWS